MPGVAALRDRDEIKRTVGRRLVEAMSEADMSIRRLACILEVDPRDVRRWRSGEVEPTFTIRRIAEALGKDDPGWFYQSYQDGGEG